MKYYSYSSLFECDINKIRKYIVESDEKNEVFKLCFDESQKDEFFTATDAGWAFDLNISTYFIGEDDYFYEFKPDGSVVKGKKCSNKSFKQLWNSRLDVAAKINKDKAYWIKILSLNNDQIHLESKSITGFDKYVFINSKRDYVIPFRLKRAKGDHAPLVIYFHGAGCLGHDNFKQLFEFFNVTFGKKFPNCNILLPQASFGSNFLYSNTEDYVKHCMELVSAVAGKCSADRNRVYCFGTSFGGCCVWYSISMYPDLFAAAVPVMGIMMHYNKYLPVLKKYNALPIWIAHSSNDSNVSIVVDDYLYSELKDSNRHIKYTRLDKYGHKMAGRFYQKEPFIPWMFAQSLDKRTDI